jgi:hypothetical protein
MSDWTPRRVQNGGGQSHFAEFVAGLTDAKDIKDVAVLIGALRVLGNQMREPRSKSLEDGLFELRGTRVRIYYGFCPGGVPCWSVDNVKKRNDTPVDVLRLMRARLKEVGNEYKKSGARAARKKG